MSAKILPAKPSSSQVGRKAIVLKHDNKAHTSHLQLQLFKAHSQTYIHNLHLQTEVQVPLLVITATIVITDATL